MRYAHLSSAYLSAEVGLWMHPRRRRARKEQENGSMPEAVPRPAKVVEFPNVTGSSGLIRTLPREAHPRVAKS
jgi:hypothetical protein